MFTVDQVSAVIAKVLDPETRLSIVEMGLIYGVKILPPSAKKLSARIHITYTLTTPLCPLADVIQERVRAEIAAAFPDFSVTPETVIMELVFEPAWSIERLSPVARAELGL